jgi:hypothetical protein
VTFPITSKSDNPGLMGILLTLGLTGFDGILHMSKATTDP